MAIDTKRNNRLNPSLMHVFRAAHQAKDPMRPAKWRDKPDRNGPETHSRSAQRTAISETVLRQEVTRDLEAMMNSISFDSSVELAEFPFVRRSILNFGFPDLASRTIDELEVAGL
ncbi:MAG: type VI secretion system baseplate subunit TssE, partial [Alphaproteobacteria bacterium]|nr:type VI secretion system baseplate subunit TssE [Alphaproteobacteria bacterium]